MVRRDRGIAPAYINQCVAFGVSGASGTLRPAESMRDQLGSLPLQSAFVCTSRVDRRMSDAAYAQLVEHYVNNEMTRLNIRDGNQRKACVVASIGFGFMHSPSRLANLTDAQYENINQVLGYLAPPHRFYNQSVGKWSLDLHNLRAHPNHPHGLRIAYHQARLHYLRPEFLAANERATLENFCDFGQEEDMIIDPEYNPATLDEDQWKLVWPTLDLGQKMTYFEVLAIFLNDLSEKKSLTAFIGSVMAMAKCGNMQERWLNTRLDQFKAQCSVDTDRNYLTLEILRIVYQDFIARAGVTAYQAYNYLLMMYHRSGVGRLEPLQWIIEQCSTVGAGGVCLVADALLSYNVRYELLIQIGISAQEIAEWCRAACGLIRNRLSAIIRPPVTASTYEHLLQLCKELVKDTTYKDYAGGRRQTSLMTSSSHRIIAAFLLKHYSDTIAAQVRPELVAQQRYGLEVEETPEGLYRSRQPVAAQNEAEAANPWSRPMTAHQMLAGCPPTRKDAALKMICEAVMLQGRQTPWRPFVPGEAQSPNTPVPPEILQACRDLGCNYEQPDDDYVTPRIIETGAVRPPWDLGCLGQRPIPGYRGMGPRGGGGGGGDDDDDDDDDDGPPPGGRFDEDPHVVFHLFRGTFPVDAIAYNHADAWAIIDRDRYLQEARDVARFREALRKTPMLVYTEEHLRLLSARPSQGPVSNRPAVVAAGQSQSQVEKTPTRSATQQQQVPPEVPQSESQQSVVEVDDQEPGPSTASLEQSISLLDTLASGRQLRATPGSRKSGGSKAAQPERPSTSSKEPRPARTKPPSSKRLQPVPETPADNDGIHPPDPKTPRVEGADPPPPQPQ